MRVFFVGLFSVLVGFFWIYFVGIVGFDFGFGLGGGGEGVRVGW